MKERAMKLKREVIQSLERESRLSETAIARLDKRCRAFEKRYGWSTEEFLRKFNGGEIGDDQDYFLWYALARAKQDWKATRESLDELLTGAQARDV
jgi:hypothetical protein